MAEVRGADTTALAVLVNYWDHMQKPAQVVEALALYTEHGHDSQTLGNSGAYLYRAYSRGASGVPINPDAAFKYLTLAVENNIKGLELAYADALYQSGRYRQSMEYYNNVVSRSAEPGYRQSYSVMELCEAKLQLAQLYFNGKGGIENWNLGYYYWQQGLKLANGPQWGSCVKDNFVYGNRYSAESSRKKFVEERISRMDSATRKTLDHAVNQPGSAGIKIAESIPAQRSNGIPSKSYGQPAKIVQASRSDWRPLSGPLCEMRGTDFPLSWSDLFERRSKSIWTVSSINRGQKTLGSAVAVSPRQLVTNCHLINNPSYIEIRQRTQKLQARLISSDEPSDRCILEVNSIMPSFVTSARPHARLKVGEDVAAIGNPKGLDTSLSRGIIAQKRRRGRHNYIQTDTAISSGSSGGGLFDRSGNLVGITTFTIADGQSLNFALAVEEFCKP